MELLPLINSISPPETDNSKSNLTNFAAKINGHQTEFVLATFSNRNLIIITQYNKISTLYSVSLEQPENGVSLAGEPVYSVREVFGMGQIESEAAARFLIEQLNLKKPTLVFINLKNYERKTITGIVEAIKNYPK